jgi:hypothetical protein
VRVDEHLAVVAEILVGVRLLVECPTADVLRRLVILDGLEGAQIVDPAREEDGDPVRFDERPEEPVLDPAPGCLTRMPSPIARVTSF